MIGPPTYPDLIPYHKSSIRGSKQHFLLAAEPLHLPAACPIQHPGYQPTLLEPDRRTFLKYGVGGAFATGLAFPTSKAQASPLADIAIEFAKAVAVSVFAEGCIWFLKEVVVPWFKEDAIPTIVEVVNYAVDYGKSFLVKKFVEIIDPPTSSPFHNLFASQGKRGLPLDFHIEPQRRDDYGEGVEIGLGEHIRRIDLNPIELDQMQREATTTIDANGQRTIGRNVDREHYYGMPLVGTGLRRSLQDPDKRALKLVNELYEPKVDGEFKPYTDAEVLYVQKLRNSKSGNHTGFGVKRGSKFQYLITNEMK